VENKRQFILAVNGKKRIIAGSGEWARREAQRKVTTTNTVTLHEILPGGKEKLRHRWRFGKHDNI